jgi:hypothetical protein
VRPWGHDRGDGRARGGGGGAAAAAAAARPRERRGDLRDHGERLAIRLALWLGVAELVAWGLLSARRQRWSWLPALVAGAVNGLFGLLIVVLEVVVH